MKTHILAAAAAALLVSVATGTAHAGPSTEPGAIDAQVAISKDKTDFTYTITGANIVKDATFTIFDIGPLTMASGGADPNTFTPHGDLATSHWMVTDDSNNLTFKFLGADIGGNENCVAASSKHAANCTFDVFGKDSRTVDFQSNNGGTKDGIGDGTYEGDDDGDDTIKAPKRVPEPASLALLGMGLAGIATARRRKAA